MATPHTRIRWDRLGRWALLFVLALVIYLYIGPARTWVSTWPEARQKREEVATLQAENRRLRARSARAQRASALEREARRLGMVKAGERAYIVEGLPTPAAGAAARRRSPWRRAGSARRRRRRRCGTSQA